MVSIDEEVKIEIETFKIGQKSFPTCSFLLLTTVSVAPICGVVRLTVRLV